MDYEKMIKEVSELVETDFCFDMDCKTLEGSKAITQEEALQMVQIIGKVYLIAHSIHCRACGQKYKITS